MIRRIIEMMMGRFQFDVIPASDGAMALAACRIAMPDIILLDWSMPNMDGLTFVTELRSMPDGKKPKIIMCTVNRLNHHITMALAAGVDEYIKKPFNIDRLAEKLERVGVHSTRMM
jgi:two-component system chemotaxis response regulator CheY